jgi:protoporphyrinogen oxidase
MARDIQMEKDVDFLIIGAGFSGLTLALRLAEAGKSVIIIENDSCVGGLASDFELATGDRLEKFYHHWFKSDLAITNLVESIGMANQIKENSSKTGMFFNSRIWNLSSPLDLMRFKAISLKSRIRLGLAVLLIRRMKNWKQIEGLSIREWLEPLCGKEAYSAVWEPLVKAKFSIHAENISAAWMWKKLVLRGGTRSKNGTESLLYIDGGFGYLANEIAARIKLMGGEIRCNEKVQYLNHAEGKILSADTNLQSRYHFNQIIFTGTPAQLTEIIDADVDKDWSDKLQSIEYLANICLILILNQSLSDTYWLNVNDPGFPFVGVIEHTNLIKTDTFANLHVVYLSRYIEKNEPEYLLSDEQYFRSCMLPLSKMFPKFQEKWIQEFHIWRSPNAQPITHKNSSSIIPEVTTPFSNLLLCSMAQVYPEDRGTNYAVENAENIANKLLHP